MRQSRFLSRFLSVSILFSFVLSLVFSFILSLSSENFLRSSSHSHFRPLLRSLSLSHPLFCPRTSCALPRIHISVLFCILYCILSLSLSFSSKHEHVVVTKFADPPSCVRERASVTSHSLTSPPIYPALELPIRKRECILRHLHPPLALLVPP